MYSIFVQINGVTGLERVTLKDYIYSYCKKITEFT